MVKYINIVLLIALLLNRQFGLAQTPSLWAITAKADKLIGENNVKQALNILENINIEDYSNESNADIATYYFNKAVAYEFNGDSLNSIKSHLKACEYFEKAGITYDHYFLSLQSLGRIYYGWGNLELSQKFYKKIVLYGTPNQLFLFKDKEFKNLDFVSDAYCNLGFIYADKEEIDMAIKCLPKIIQHKDSFNLKLQHILYDYIINSLTSKSLEHRKEGKYYMALNVFDKLLPLIERYKGSSNEKYIQILASKGLVLGHNLGLYEKAIPIFELNIRLRDVL